MKGDRRGLSLQRRYASDTVNYGVTDATIKQRILQPSGGYYYNRAADAMIYGQKFEIVRPHRCIACIAYRTGAELDRTGAVR